MMSCLSAMASLRYGSVRKKSRLRAEHSAVATAAHRPPNSATVIVKARKKKVKFEAVVNPRRGTSAMPSRIAARGPTPR